MRSSSRTISLLLTISVAATAAAQPAPTHAQALDDSTISRPELVSILQGPWFDVLVSTPAGLKSIVADPRPVELVRDCRSASFTSTFAATSPGAWSDVNLTGATGPLVTFTVVPRAGVAASCVNDVQRARLARGLLAVERLDVNELREREVTSARVLVNGRRVEAFHDDRIPLRLLRTGADEFSADGFSELRVAVALDDLLPASSDSTPTVRLVVRGADSLQVGEVVIPHAYLQSLWSAHLPMRLVRLGVGEGVVDEAKALVAAETKPRLRLQSQMRAVTLLRGVGDSVGARVTLAGAVAEHPCLATSAQSTRAGHPDVQLAGNRCSAVPASTIFFRSLVPGGGQVVTGRRRQGLQLRALIGGLVLSSGALRLLAERQYASYQEAISTRDAKSRYETANGTRTVAGGVLVGAGVVWVASTIDAWIRERRLASELRMLKAYQVTMTEAR